MALLVVSMLFLAACNSGAAPQALEKKTFRLGFIPTEKAQELTPKAEKMAEFLEAEMGEEVEVLVPTDYEALIEGLKFGHLDAAFMDGGPAWMAYKRANAEVVMAELKDGEPFYFAEIYKRTGDESIKSLEDVPGKKIAFTSWTGSSGFIFPIGMMVERGFFTPEGDDFVALEKAIAENFEQYVVAGGYSQALELLVSGKVDVAAGAHDAAEKYLSEADRGKIESVERLGKVPSHPVMVSSDLEQSRKAAFVAAMMKLNNPENVQILENLYGVSGLVETTTMEHLGDFGKVFEVLTGVHDQVFNKKD